MNNENLRDLTLVKFQKLLSDNNTELKKINSNFNTLNKILSVDLIFKLQNTNFITKNQNEIEKIMPKYIEVLNLINKNIK